MARAYFQQFISGIRIGKIKKTEDQALVLLVNSLNKGVDSGSPLAQELYTAFDLETTGLYPFGGDRVISLGAVCMKEGQVAQKVFERLVDPGRPVPAEIQALTGITDAAVAGSPNLLGVLPSFIKFLLQGIPLGYNADFDLAFLNSALRFNCGVKINRAVVLDVLTVVRALNPRWEYFGLDDIAAYYGVPLDARHTAVGDAVIHARLFCCLVPLLEDRGVYTFKELKRYLHYRSLF
jgi:DNA polymerase-3 subunit epsilon